jgi:hypothetical protein
MNGWQRAQRLMFLAGLIVGFTLGSFLTASIFFIQGVTP